ncbi:MAG: polymer-forming cytoskeletal protein [Acidobacteriota bacterium]|jgi:cytoskeletal protein CcmA (bactofilin family)
MIFKTDHPEGELNGFVDAGSQFRGELRFDTSFRIEGRVEGSVISDGVLVVGEGGEVDGEIQIGQIYVSGTVKGTVKATRKVQLCSSGRLFADLETPSLAIEDGAVFEGRCVMNRERDRGDQKTAGSARESLPDERDESQPIGPVPVSAGEKS